MTRPDVAVAARNNAEWCDLVCRAHDVLGAFGRDAWTTARRSPQYYPDAVTLDPRATGAAILDRVDASAGCSVKDSFATLDLGPHGFRILFEAEWVGRGARPASTHDAAGWHEVEDARELIEWQTAGGSGAPSPIRPELLRDPNVVVLAGHRDRRVTAGAILNRGAGVIGLSNLFADAAGLDSAWNAAIGAATDRFPGVAIVGYESGDELAAAHRCGFVSLGALRVWTNDDD
jgi:hypothetical protein